MHEELRRALARARALRFLCSGNMVRSAFAELYARHRGCPLPVDSAACTYRNDHLHPRAHAALAARGVPARALDGFRPRHLADLGRPAEGLVVFGMTRAHLDAWHSAAPEATRGALLSAALGAAGEILDPVLDRTSFDVAFESVAACVDALLDALEARA
jgi:protein-tyrosine-phosphatase